MNGHTVARVIYAVLAIGAAYILGVRILGAAPISEMILPVLILGFCSYRLFTMEEE
jgi:hypothetical protein